MPRVTKSFLLMWNEVTNLLEMKGQCFLCKQATRISLHFCCRFLWITELTVSGVKQFHRALKKHCVGKPKSCEKIREMQIVNYKCKHKELFRAMKSYGQVHSVPLSLEKKMRKEWRPTQKSELLKNQVLFPISGALFSKQASKKLRLKLEDLPMGKTEYYQNLLFRSLLNYQRKNTYFPLCQDCLKTC